MTTATMDFEGTRGKLREQIEQAEDDLVDVRDRVGELALDCQLGNAPQEKLDKANNEQVTLTARIEGLKAALAKLDEREADHVTAEAEKRRQADEKRLAELQRTCNAAGVKVIDIAAKLADVLAEGHAAVQEADMLCRRLEVSTITIQGWTLTAHKVISARIGTGGGFLPGEQAAAELALTGRE